MSNIRNMKFLCVLFAMAFLLMAEAVIVRFPASAESNTVRPTGQSLVEVDADVDFAVIRVTENKTVIHFEELSFVPASYSGMAAWNQLVSGECCRATITNEFDEWARVALTYEQINGVHKLIGPADWEWTDFINDEVWTIDFYVYRPNDVTLNYKITANDIRSVYGYYALPDTEYANVKGLAEALDDAVIGPIIVDGVKHILNEVKNGGDAVAYGDYYNIDFGGGEVTWTMAMSVDTLGKVNWKVWLGIGLAVVGVAVCVAAVVCPPAAAAGVYLAVAGVGMAAAGILVTVAGVKDTVHDKLNEIAAEAETVPEIAAKEIEENIEFDVDDDSASMEKVLKLAFYKLDGDGNRIGDAVLVRDRSGRQIYYNKNTRVVGNDTYCLLDPDGLWLLKVMPDKKIRSVNGNRTFAALLYDPEADTSGYFEELEMPYPDHIGGGFWILSTTAKKPPLSFLTQREYEVQVKNTFDRRNSSKHMILIDNDAAQINYMTNKTASASENSSSQNIWEYIKDALGLGGKSMFDNGCSAGLSKFVGWLLIFVGFVILALVVWLVVWVVKRLIWLFRG